MDLKPATLSLAHSSPPMRLVLGTAIFVLLVFLILVLMGNDKAPHQPIPQTMEVALQLTIRLFGATTSIVSAIGLLLVAASKGPMERQIALVLPLLAGLLLLSTTWSLGIAVGAVAVTWLLRREPPSQTD